ncbi:hypothetical protein Tsubulata_035459 [Turnera subulata]|uniref:Uncharacterized protein n=1 Tax=Turnera subulata TaxID=218843 RepID=A0A9Q0F5G2_9ROSI|nr:hypothetical protein Tsubulata_035459 [Turnera subulata]
MGPSGLFFAFAVTLYMVVSSLATVHTVGGWTLGSTWTDKNFAAVDDIALFFNTSAPPTYSLWVKNSSAAESELKNGMNFAFGGSGALTTWENVTLSVQLRQFKQLVESMVFTPSDLQDSVAVLSSIGNDWAYFSAMHHGRPTRDCIKMVVLDYDKLLDAVKAMYDKVKGNTKDNCCQILEKFKGNYTVMCGDNDESGNKVYTLCQDPAQYFYFFRQHLSHDAWKKMNTLFVEWKVLEPLRS